jgi:hypothetical protein
MLATIATAPREPLAIRRKALAALRSIGSDDAAGTYLKLARSTEEPALLRSEAVDGLRTVLDQPGVRAALPGLVRDAEPNVRLAAATLAGEACVTEAAEALAAAESGEPNAWVASAIAAARSELASCGGR